MENSDRRCGRNSDPSHLIFDTNGSDPLIYAMETNSATRNRPCLKDSICIGLVCLLFNSEYSTHQNMEITIATIIRRISSS